MKMRIGLGESLYNHPADSTGMFVTEIDVTPEEHARILAAFAEWDAVQELLDERVEAATRKNTD